MMRGSAAGATKRIALGIAAGLVLTALVLAGIFYGGRFVPLFRDPEQIQRAIRNWGGWAPVALIAVQILQVVIAPLPGNVVAIVGGYVFGLGKGLLLCMIGVLAGAALAFGIGRVFGRRLLRLFVAEATLNRFDAFIVTRGPFYLFLLLLFPNPIGDWLYYLAGLTAIPLPVFLVLVLAGRIPSNLFETFVGVQMLRFGSQAYRLTWCHWTLIAAALIVIAGVYYLNRKRIERLFLRLTRFPNE